MNSPTGFCIIALCALALISCQTTNNDSCLASLGAEKVSLPYSSGRINYDTQSADNEVRNCVLRMFEEQILHTPLTFDEGYRPCLNYHREDSDLIYADIPHDKTFVVHLDSTERYDVYLLHEETGRVMEGEYYDILFTTDKHGKLINQLIVGAMGIMYSRNFSVLPSMRFTITETTGREDTRGPRYKGEFSIDKTGKFVLVRSTTEQTTEGGNDVEELSESKNTKSYNDIIGIEQNKDIKASLESILFSENQSEDYFEPFTFFGKKCWLAVGTISTQESGVADFSVILVHPLPKGTSTDNSVQMYKTDGYALPGGRGSDLLRGEITKVRANKKGAQYLITVSIRRLWLVPGGDTTIQQPTQRQVDTDYVFSYNEAGEFRLQE